MIFESSPTDEQKHRLQDWLTELMIICRQYKLVVADVDGDVQITDLINGKVIGVGLTPLTDVLQPTKITAYDAAGSILDGSWLVDTDAGPVEQRLVARVHPAPRQET